MPTEIHAAPSLNHLRSLNGEANTISIIWERFQWISEIALNKQYIIAGATFSRQKQYHFDSLVIDNASKKCKCCKNTCWFYRSWQLCFRSQLVFSVNFQCHHIRASSRYEVLPLFAFKSAALSCFCWGWINKLSSSTQTALNEDPYSAINFAWNAAGLRPHRPCPSIPRLCCSAWKYWMMALH